jgi:hypothetical protein
MAIPTIKSYDIFKNTVKVEENGNIKIDTTKYDKINKILANLSVADTSHDIDKKDKGIPGITGFLKKSTNIYAQMYQEGLPVEYTSGSILDEDQAVGSVIESTSFEWGPAPEPPPGSPASSPIPSQHNELFKNKPYIPLRVMKYIKEGRTPIPDKADDYSDPEERYVRPDRQTHSITTVNDNKYVVKYFNVKPEKNGGKGDEIINAETFFKHMGYEDTTQDINIAFVVDCTSITFEDILNKGPKLGQNFKTYLIKSPEGENDPGGKTNLQDKSFKEYESDGNKGVRYKAAVPYDLKKTNSYVYYFTESKKLKISPYTQFFTNYCFSLSELQFDDKYIFSDLTTTINITDPRNTAVPTKTVLNSGDMNKITAVSNTVRNILEKIKKYKSNSATDTFDYNCALQQKRSGDWFQALLTCLVALGERKFCEYNSPNFDIFKIFKKKEIIDGTLIDPNGPHDGARQPVINFQQKDVYLVTHDRILLAFSLLLGINVIFTHHFPGSRGYSYHSALVYKIENPLEKSQSKLKVMEDFFNGVKGLPAGKRPFHAILEEYINNLNKMYKRFNNHIDRYKSGIPLLKVNNSLEDGPDGVESADNLNKHISDFTEIIHRLDRTEAKSITSDEINTNTQKIFALAFKIALIKTTFPDLYNLIDYVREITTFKDQIRIIKGKLITDVFGNYKNPSEPSQEENVEHFLLLGNERVLYDKIIEMLSKYNEINNRIVILNKNLQGFNSFIGNMEKSLKKNPTFGLISAWRTSNAPKCNLWVQYNNVLNPNWAFINDKNIFLYELTKLDDELKDKICTVYLELFNAIKIPANIAGSGALQAKTQQNVLSFCLEVFVNLGPFVINDGTRNSIKDEIDTYLKTPLKLQVPAEEAPRDTSTEPKTFNPNRFNEVIAELKALNATSTNADKTINVVTIPELQGEDSKTYDPIVTPVVIEELIEINVKKDNTIENKDEGTNIDTASGNPNSKYSLNKDGYVTVELPDTILADKGEIADTVFEPVSDDALQDGGRKRSQDISFIFDNKMAPKYLAATNLFVSRPVIQDYSTFNYVLDKLSGASVGRRYELSNPSPLQRLDILSQPDIDEHASLPTAPAGLEDLNRIGGQIGGSHEEIESLLSSDESILVNEKIASHPLLSIYLILESYCTELSVTSIEDSWDYENFVQFFEIANAMINNLLKIYSGDNKTNMNELKACMVGYGLRELIFTSPQYIERDPICIDALDIKLENYNPLSKIFSIFVNRVCGSVNQTPEDIELGSKYINNQIFKEYATRIEFNRIFDSNVSEVNIYELSLKAQNLFLEVGNKIISDTNGIENNTLLELTENNPLPLINNLEEVSAASSDVLVESPPPSADILVEPPSQSTQIASNLLAENQGKGISSKQITPTKKGIHTFSDFQGDKAASIKTSTKPPIKKGIYTISDYKSEKPSSGIIQYVSPIGEGGKKTKKHKKYLKTKITRGKARKYKNRTRKHRTIKYKINKKLNKRSKRNRKYN